MRVESNDNGVGANSSLGPESTLVTRQVELTALRPNTHQPRKIFDDQAIEELARSIEWHGLLQPISIQSAIGGDGFIIIAGERRVRAYKKLGRSHIEAVVVDGNPAELALIENLQREDLHPLDLAEGLARLQDEFQYKDGDLADVISKSRPTVNELLRLNTLPDCIKSECRTFDTVSKGALLQVARGGTSEEQERLWQAVRSSETVRSLKSKRRKNGTNKAGTADVYKSLIVAEQTLLRRFDRMPSDWRLDSASHYHEFVMLRDRLTSAIKAYQKDNGGEIRVEERTTIPE